jgi:glycosyltransferase involved in cell wall biosynthesis
MKIILVQDHLRSGGTERQTVLLANAFAAAGDDVTLITFRPGGAIAGTVSSNVKHVSLQPFDLGLDWVAPGLFGRLSAAKPDVVLCMGRMANCYAGRIQRALPGAHVIATLRTGRSIPGPFRSSLLTASHVIANSQEAADLAVSGLSVPADRISVIRNALVFPASAAPDKARALRESLGAGEGTTVLLCTAMFRPEKNQRELVEIVKDLPERLDWALWLAGDGPARAACERHAAELGLEARVRFPGWQADPSAFYRAGNIAVHASRSESLSNFIIEAQAQGLPAVACEALGMRECLVPDTTGFVVPHGDREAFRAAILRLADTPSEEVASRAEAARRFAREAFDPARQVAAHRELFARLLSKAR